MAVNWDDFKPLDGAAPSSAGPVNWDDFKPAPKERGGLVASLKSTTGQLVKGAGQVAADYLPGVSQDNALKQYGQEVIDANPLTVNSLADLKDSPWAAVKEATGNALGSMGAMVGSKAVGEGLKAVAPALPGVARPIAQGVGSLISAAGPVATAALPSYGGIREAQIQGDPSRADSLESKLLAAGGAAAVGGIETKFGPQEWALRAMKKEGRDALVQNLAGKSLVGSIGKGIAKGAAIEGAEEFVQNPVEQLASYQDPRTAESLTETAFGGAMGALGGGVLGGAGGGAAYVARPSQPQADPNAGPLSRAAATAEVSGASAPVETPPEVAADPFAGRTAQVASMVEDKELLRALRGDGRFGKESVTELLGAWAVARNPQADPATRERALASIEQFLSPLVGPGVFGGQQNFTMPQGEADTFVRDPATGIVPAGSQAVTAPAQSTFDPNTLEGQAREVGTLPRQMIEGPQGDAQTDPRRALLDSILADPETKNPLARYESALKRGGFPQRRATPTERALLTAPREERPALPPFAAVESVRRAAFPMSREGAERQAAQRSQESGQRFEAVPHPTVKGRFAVQPVADQVRDAAKMIAPVTESQGGANAQNQTDRAGQGDIGPALDRQGVPMVGQGTAAPDTGVQVGTGAASARPASARVGQTYESGDATSPVAFDVTDRNDDQLRYLATNGRAGWKEAAQAEIARRTSTTQEQSPNVETPAQALPQQAQREEAQPATAGAGVANAAQSAPLGTQESQASRPQGEAQGGAQEPGQGVEALRTQLQNVERDILAAAPPKFSVGGGDIEGAMRSLKVPRALKEQRKAIKEQMRVAQQPRSELDTVAERIPATHADAGQTPEQATAPVIREAIQKSARNTAFNAREAKAWLLGEIDKAIADVPPANRDMAADLAQERARTFKPSDRVAKLGKGTMRDKLEREERENFEAMKADRIAKTARMIGFVTFDVPGDGRFKVVNTPEALQAFADKVKSSPGFRDNPTVKPSFGTGNAQGSSLDESLKRLGNTPEALQEIGNAIEIARLRKAKDEDKLLDRFREASGGKEYDAWRAEQEADEEVAAREAADEAGQPAPAESAAPQAPQGKAAEMQADTPERIAVATVREVAKADPFGAYDSVRDEALKLVKERTGKNWSDLGLRSSMFSDDLSEPIHAGQLEGQRAYAATLPVDVSDAGISLGEATRAFEGTSHSPEKRARSVQRSVFQQLLGLWRKLERAYANAPADRQEAFVEAFNEAAGRYKELVRGYLASHSRVMSSMIVGPARFPVASNQKKSDAADAKQKAAEDFISKTPARLLKVLRGATDNSVQSSLREAESKLASREAQQAHMKKINAAHAKFQKDPASLDKTDLSQADRDLIRNHKPRYSWEPHPFAPYELTNNNAEVRRLKSRVDELKRRIEEADAAPAEEVEQAEDAPVRIVRNTQAGRLQLFFNGKPSEEVRTALKSSGFKWAPSASAWQRMLTDNAIADAERIAREHFGIQRSFAGEFARTADTHALASARSRIAAGEDAETVRQETGWHRGADSQWRFEINDADARLKSGEDTSTNPAAFIDWIDEAQGRADGIPLSQAFDHPALFAAYPQLQSVRLRVDPDMKAGNAKYSPKQGSFGTITITDPFNLTPEQYAKLPSIVLHEVQHAIQSVEGFAVGGSPEQMAKERTRAKDLRDRFTMARALGLAAEQNFDGNVDAAAQWFREAGFDADPAVDVLMTEGLPRVQRLAERYEARAKELGIDSRGGQDGRDLYKRLAGEVEARNTQTRQKMSDAERRAVSPGFTADVADADVIVTFNGREMANAPAPANAEPAGTTQDAILAAIRDLVGPLRTKRITVVQSADELVTQGALSSKDADGTQAFVKDGKAYFIAGNIRPGNERAVFLHEVGSHLGMEKILSPFARKVLLTKIRNFAQQSGTLESRIAKAAQRRVEAAGATGTDAESELLAYFVEEAVKAGVNPTADAQSAIGQWFRQFMADVRKALEKLGLLSPKALTAQDVVDMARGAAQVAMEQEGASETQFSRDQTRTDYASTAKRGKPVENEIVVFDSSQVKSAIGNSGAFDPADARIQFSKAASAIGATWDVPESSKLFNRFDTDSLLYTLQDKHIDTRRVVEAIRKQSGDIADEFNPYLQEELFHGRSAKGVKDFLDSELRPLLAEMTLRKVSMADLEEFLHARHAEERNIQIAKINPKMPDGGSGMETQTARDYLAALDPAKKATYDALARKIDAINAATRDVLVQSGLEKPETVKAWEGAYKHYVPLQREEVESDGLRIGQGFSVKGSASKRAMGSDKNVVDIIANIAMQRERAIVRAEKNRVAQALYGLSLKAPNPDFWITVNPADAKAYTPKQQQTVIDELVSMGLDPADAQSFVKEPTQRYVDPRTGLVSERINPVMRSAPNVLSVRVNGEDRYVFFNESDARASRMVHALKNLDADQLGRLLQTSAKITRWFASVNTQFNPVFGAINILRDVQSAMLNLSTTPLRGKEGKVLADTFSALRGIYSDLRAIRKGGTASSQWASLWEEFQKEGGQTGYRDMFSNSTERAEAIQKELDQIGEGKLKTRGRAMFNWLSDYNEAMENAVRLAAYKEAKDKGLSNQQAASLAKNLTVNFNRKGQIAAQAGALYAFFNASAQGSYRMLQTIKGPAGRKIILGGLTLGALQAVTLAMAGFDDDEPPQFVRERSIIVPDFVAGSGKYLSIPMPIGFHVIPNISRILTEWALGGFQHTGDRISSLLGLFADTFNPIGNAGVSMQTIAPTALDPFAALAENKDWTGKPIARADFNSLDPSPGFTRAKDTASAVSKAIAYFANLATGGTDYKPGLVSPSPDQIDYLLGQLTGGVGREYMKAEQTVTSIVTGEDLPSHKIPLLGRFYGDTTGQASEANRFYANLREVNMHKSEIEGRRKAGEDVMGYLQDNPTARLSVGASRFETQLRKLKQARRAAMNADAEPERIQQIDAQITTVMHSFNARFAQLEAQ